MVAVTVDGMSQYSVTLVVHVKRTRWVFWDKNISKPNHTLMINDNNMWYVIIYVCTLCAYTRNYLKIQHPMNESVNLNCLIYLVKGSLRYNTKERQLLFTSGQAFKIVYFCSNFYRSRGNWYWLFIHNIIPTTIITIHNGLVIRWWRFPTANKHCSSTSSCQKMLSSKLSKNAKKLFPLLWRQWSFGEVFATTKRVWCT